MTAERPLVVGFELLSEIGSGALSTVYKAVQESTGRVVALKVLTSTISPRSPFAAQLEREARLLSDLRHSSVLMLIDFVKTDATMALVLEHVDGFSAAEMLAKRPKWPSDCVAAIGCLSARGLAHVHERGIIHRDMKPKNLLIAKTGDVKLIDFGIAHRDRLPSVDEPLTDEGSSAFGTASYMSPEQILGERVDARSDIFSLGLILYEMLAGCRPFESPGKGEARAALSRVRQKHAVPLTSRAPDVPPVLARAVMQALEPHPADRWPTADALADTLERIVRARPLDGPQKPIRRALAQAGMLAGERVTTPAPFKAEAGPSQRHDWLMLAAIGAVGVLGVVALGWRDHRDRARSGIEEPMLPLAPHSPGWLRIVVEPWGDVSIDGQHLDLTPIGRPIALDEGTHFLRVTHPDAPPDQRSVRVTAGETISVDVVMALRADAGQGAAPDAGSVAHSVEQANRTRSKGGEK